MMQLKVVCFGETLWDILPSSTLPGGAPMNVAIHFKYNGFSPLFISRIGEDTLGKALLKVLKDKEIITDYIQLDPIHPTGVVIADIDNKKEVTYQIQHEVAWDYITYDEKTTLAVAQSDLFIYGSLASRSKTTQQTLLDYIPFAKLKVFDVNLRPPHYTPKLVQQLMQHADIVKMNYRELIEMMSWFGKIAPEKEAMAYLKQRFNINMLLVSRGDKGAILLNEEAYVEHGGFQVEVEDTIGSGDAFLAAFLSKIIQQVPVQEALEFACATGACVATKSGALPHFTESQIKDFIQAHRQVKKP
jgi:fructokinase